MHACEQDDCIDDWPGAVGMSQDWDVRGRREPTRITFSDDESSDPADNGDSGQGNDTLSHRRVPETQWAPQSRHQFSDARH